ncbi:tRNA (Cytosine-5-)-methyltransferase [Entamoeba marina]
MELLIKPIYLPFLDGITTPLPIVVIINPNTPYYNHLQPYLSPIEKLPGAFISSLPKQVLTSLLDRSHLSRQELCSQLPVYIINQLLSSSSSILDICAAPGSKTFQLAITPTYSIHANDVSAHRLRTLIHRLRPFSNISVTNCSATQVRGMYDAVLCDAPCSGDGTMRKSKSIWSHWKLTDAIMAHSPQLTIATAALSHVKPGGILVYSTCALNPIEDEAVVAQLLRNHSNLKLINIHEIWEGGRKGLKTWKSTTEKGPKSIQPPNPTEDFNLDYTLRVLPQDINSGGFFVALFTVNDSNLDDIHNSIDNIHGISDDVGMYKRIDENDAVWDLLTSNLGLTVPREKVVKRKDGVVYALYDGDDLNYVIHCGVRLFERRSHGTESTTYRLCSESLTTITTVLSEKQFYDVDEETLFLLEKSPIKLNSFQSQKLNQISEGSMILRIKDSKSVFNDFLFPAWKGRETINHAISKDEWSILKFFCEK